MPSIRRHLRPSLAALAACAVLAASPARAETIRLEEIKVGEVKDGVCNVHPIDQATTHDHGNVLWFIEAGAKRIGRLDLATGAVEKIAMPAVTPVTYTTDSLDSLPGNDGVHGPCDLVLTDDGKLWFNYQSANAVGIMDTKPPYAITLLPMPSPASLPMAMQMGADGNIYVQLTAVNKVARIDPKTRKIREFALPHAGGSVVGGAADKAAGAHWFVTMRSNRLVRFDYASQAMEEFEIPTANAAPFVVRAYDDGIWFTMYGANAIGHFDPATRQFTEIAIPTQASAPIGIVSGADGDLYVNLSTTDKIVRIDRKRRTVIAEYPLPTKKAWPDEIKQGPDGAIWVTQYFGGTIARLWLSSFGEDPGFPLKGK